MTEKALAIDTETTGLYIRKGCRAFLVIACDSDGNTFSWEFPVDPFTREVDYLSSKSKKLIANMFKVFKEYPIYIFHNCLFDITVLEKFGKRFTTLFESRAVHDTMYMCHAFNSLLPKGLKERAYFLLNYPEDDEKELLKTVIRCRKIASKLGWATSEPTHPHLTPMKKDKPKSDYWLPATLARLAPSSLPENMNVQVCNTYGCGDVERTMGLYLLFSEELKKKEPGLPTSRWEQYELNQKLIFPLKRMQDKGLQLNVKEFPKNHRKIKNKKVEIKRKLATISNAPELNPRSPDQLIKILHEDLELPIIKKTATGRPSTSKDVLSDLLDKSERSETGTKIQVDFLSNLLSYKKLEATERYLTSYSLYETEGKLFGSIDPVGTKTTRVACRNPNLQNIAKKNPKGFEHLGVVLSLRGMFGPPPGHVWVCIDYSQLQLRIFAYACGDKTLINAFENGEDIHDAVARKVFNTETPTPEERRKAKGINFGIIFGAGKNKIEAMTGIKGSYQTFKNKFTIVDEYMAKQSKRAKDLGFCSTLGGYPLNIQKSKAYKACNYVVQGTEGELVKEAIYQTDKYCLNKNVPFSPVVPIHDEIIFESKIPMTIEEAKTKYKPNLSKIEQLMRDASLIYGVPTEVDTKITDSVWSVAG